MIIHRMATITPISMTRKKRRFLKDFRGLGHRRTNNLRNVWRCCTVRGQRQTPTRFTVFPCLPRSVCRICGPGSFRKDFENGKMNKIWKDAIKDVGNIPTGWIWDFGEDGETPCLESHDGWALWPMEGELRITNDRDNIPALLISNTVLEHVLKVGSLYDDRIRCLSKFVDHVRRIQNGKSAGSNKNPQGIRKTQR